MAKKKNKLPPFVYITKKMLSSDAFKELSNTSRIALLLLRAQLKSHDQKEVIYPYSHAQEYMKRDTFARAIKKLEKMGFIKKTQYGGLYRKTNVYTFTDAWEEYKKPVGNGILYKEVRKGDCQKCNFGANKSRKGDCQEVKKVFDGSEKGIVHGPEMGTWA